jgi:DNA (cytosine-5)-methyltransferase 1
MSADKGNANAGGQVAVAYNIYPASGQGADLEMSQTDIAMACTTVDARKHERGTRIVGSVGVRRLTPRECERLQGFPDDWTLIPYRGGFAKDGPRYEAIGNSMAVPVIRWIGQRIAMVQSLIDERRATEVA